MSSIPETVPFPMESFPEEIRRGVAENKIFIEEVFESEKYKELLSEDLEIIPYEAVSAINVNEETNKYVKSIAPSESGNRKGVDSNGKKKSSSKVLLTLKDSYEMQDIEVNDPSLEVQREPKSKTDIASSSTIEGVKKTIKSLFQIKDQKTLDAIWSKREEIFQYADLSKVHAFVAYMIQKHGNEFIRKSEDRNRGRFSIIASKSESEVNTETVCDTFRTDPLYCPFYFSNFRDFSDQVKEESIKTYLKSKELIKSYIDSVELNVVVPYDYFISYYENTSEKPQGLLTAKKDVDKVIFEIFGLAGSLNSHEYKKKATEYSEMRFLEFACDNLLNYDPVSNLTEFLQEMKGIVGQSSVPNGAEDWKYWLNVEKVAYILRCFRTVFDKNNVSDGADDIELYFKKKGNAILSEYENVSSSLRVYVRINTGPPPGVVSPYYKNVQNICELNKGKRSCQSIDDCSVASAVTEKGFKSRVYRKQEGYSEVFYRMTADEMNETNAEELFRECYPSKELLENVKLKGAVIGTDLQIESLSVDNLKKELNIYFNSDETLWEAYDLNAVVVPSKSRLPKLFITVRNPTNSSKSIYFQVMKISKNRIRIHLLYMH